MPDIKSAMQAALFRAPAALNPVVQKTLNEWDDEGEGPSFPINISSTGAASAPAKKKNYNNVMRETFDCILNNPGLTAKEIANKLEEQGFKASSVTSVVSQLWRSGQLFRDGIAYRCTSSTYMPISRKNQIVVQKTTPQSQGIAALTPVPAPAPVPVHKPVPVPVTEPDFDPRKMIGTLSVYHAKDLYEELKTMFGG